MTQKPLASALRRGVAACAVMISLTGVAGAEPFAATGDFDGRIGASGPERGPILAGGTAQIQARGLAPNQPVTLRQGGETLEGGPFSADDAGELAASITIPEGAAPGIYPVVVELGGEAASATILDLKVSTDPGDVNAEAYDQQSAEVATRPYQVASGDGALFVTSAVGRPPVKESELVKLDPETLEPIARVSPEAAPAREDGSDGGLFAVYGIGLAPGQVWVTNTRQDTVAVYSFEDLSLVKQFAPGTVPHSRDVVHHDGKVYVTATFEPTVHVFDADSLEELEPITLESGRRGQDFATASLSLAPEAGKLFVSSLRSEEVAVVDLDTGEETAVWQVPGSANTIGIAASPDGSRVYTVAQGNDAISVLDGASGELLNQVNVGANPLNAVVDPATGHVYVAMRGNAAVAVLDADGTLVANLKGNDTPNHLTVDDAGRVYVVDQSTGSLTRIVAK